MLKRKRLPKSRNKSLSRPSFYSELQQEKKNTSDFKFTSYNNALYERSRTDLSSFGRSRR